MITINYIHVFEVLSFSITNSTVADRGSCPSLSEGVPATKARLLTYSVDHICKLLPDAVALKRIAFLVSFPNALVTSTDFFVRMQFRATPAFT